jgi:hypothetical protein
MTIAHLEVSFPTSLRRFVPRPPIAAQLYQVKWDHEISETQLAERPDNRPMIFRPEPFNKTLLNEAAQRLWFANIEIEGAGLTPEQLRQVWRWMTDHNRAYTNGVGCDILRDYILRQRMDLGLPGMFPLLTGGAVLKGKETTYRGIRQLEIDHIGADGKAPDGATAITHGTHPWLIAYAVNSTKKQLEDGTYLVNPWTTELWQGRNAPVPLIAREAIYYPLERLKKLPVGAPVPSPYNPPR